MRPRHLELENRRDELVAALTKLDGEISALRVDARSPRLSELEPRRRSLIAALVSIDAEIAKELATAEPDSETLFDGADDFS